MLSCLFLSVTVCPPKETKTNLNLDFLDMEKKKWDLVDQSEVFEEGCILIQDEVFQDALKEVESINTSHKYSSWYQESYNASFTLFIVKEFKGLIFTFFIQI